MVGTQIDFKWTNEQLSKAVGKQPIMKPPESVLLALGEPKQGNRTYKPFTWVPASDWSMDFWFGFWRSAMKFQNMALEIQKKFMNKSSGIVPVGY